MGSGSSKIGGRAPAKANTPSGVSYKDFMKMSDSQKYSTMRNIINDNNIKVPVYLDGSDTSKVMYALGMNQTPTVVSDDQLDKMPGRELYRTVYQTGTMPPPSSDDVLDQIRNGEYTQLSGRGGSVHGRALYFATDFTGSSSYGMGEKNAMVMRAKIDPKANIRSENSLRTQMATDANWNSVSGSRDDIALYALAKGIDGWYSGGYTMMVNRGVLTASSKNKYITSGKGAGQTKTGRLRKGYSYASSWSAAEDAN